MMRATANGFLGAAMRQAAVLLLLAALPSAGMWVWQQRAGKKNASGGSEQLTAVANAAGMVNLAQTTAWGESVLWVDARRKTDFERAHIPGAMLLNEDSWDELLPALIERWSPDKRVVVYCDGGACRASQQVGARLRDAGVSPVYILHGGWPAWEKQQEGRTPP